jgi:hypothetical protein
MLQTKTRQDRERELQALISTPQGRVDLERLASQYQDDSGRARPVRTSVITYILVHERQLGLIAG